MTDIQQLVESIRLAEVEVGITRTRSREATATAEALARDLSQALEQRVILYAQFNQRMLEAAGTYEQPAPDREAPTMFVPVGRASYP